MSLHRYRQALRENEERLTVAPLHGCLLVANMSSRHSYWFSGLTALPLGFIGAAVVFLPVFVFLPCVIRTVMKVDTDAVRGAFGKIGQVKMIFCAVFIAFAGLILAQVADPATAKAFLSLITSTG